MGDGGRLAVVDDDGSVRRALPVGRGGCQPVRWWRAGVALARCDGQLWEVPVDGTAPAALTGTPPGGTGLDLGWTDAVRVGATAVVQRSGDCGAASVEILGRGGSATRLDLGEEPHQAVLVDAVGDRMAVWVREGCDGAGLWLAWYDAGGNRLATLAERAAAAAGPERGIRDVLPYPSGPPAV